MATDKRDVLDHLEYCIRTNKHPGIEYLIRLLQEYNKLRKEYYLEVAAHKATMARAIYASGPGRKIMRLGVKAKDYRMRRRGTGKTSRKKSSKRGKRG